MDIAIIGLGNAGKTSLFNVMSGGDAPAEPFSDVNADPNVAMVKVPDERLDWLSNLFNPKKKTPVEFRLTDYGPLAKSEKGKELTNKFIGDIRNADAIILCIRAFESESAPHPDGSIDPARDLENVLMELRFADLDLAERRIGRIDDSIHKGKKEDRDKYLKEKSLMERIVEKLESGGSVRDVEISDEEQKIVRGYQFFSETPILVAVNVGEGQIGEGIAEALRAKVDLSGAPIVELSCAIEAELAQLDDEDKAAFMEDLGITEPARDRVVRAAWEALGVQYFFTVGEDECRAWSIKVGDNAVAAAGKIHSDIAKGFIRAEVVKYADLKEHGSMAKVKEAGLMRLEGKEHIVNDGDIVHFRFNV